jgi:hypothetical protein
MVLPKSAGTRLVLAVVYSDTDRWWSLIAFRSHSDHILMIVMAERRCRYGQSAAVYQQYMKESQRLDCTMQSPGVVLYSLASYRFPITERPSLFPCVALPRSASPAPLMHWNSSAARSRSNAVIKTAASRAFGHSNSFANTHQPNHGARPTTRCRRRW